MSDLQCPATLLLVPPHLVGALVPTLSGRRVAQVWSSSAPDAVSAAGPAAAALGVGATTSNDLRDPDRRHGTLTGIADQHRGETVLIVVDGGDEVVEVSIDGDGWVTRSV